MNLRAFSLFVIFSCILLGGCGYHLQGAHSQVLEDLGVRRIYLEPLRNDSYKAGVENVVYNALMKTLTSGRRVQIVGKPELADAILSGKVDTAVYSAVGSVGADKLQPSDLPGISPIPIATTYQATLQCSFSLNRRLGAMPEKKANLWASTFARSKSFPGSNQLDVLGTTSSLINESDFDRALVDLAASMMSDVHETMLNIF